MSSNSTPISTSPQSLDGSRSLLIPAPHQPREARHIGWLRRTRESKPFVLFVVCLAVFTDMFVYGVVLPILPKLFERIGYDDAEGLASIELLSGTMFATFSVGVLVATPFLGVLSDRYRNRKIPMLVGLVGLALSTVMFIVSRQLWGLVIARFFQGVSGAATWAIGFAMLADTYPVKELGTVAGIALGMNTLGYLVGPTLGGVLAKYVSLDFPFYVCLLFVAIDLLARLMIITPDRHRDSRPGNDTQVHTDLGHEQPASAYAPTTTSTTVAATSPSPDSTRLGIIQMMLIPEIALVCGMCVLAASSISCIEALLPTYLWDRFRSDEAMTALLMLALILPNILTDALAGYLSGRYSRDKIMCIGLLLHGAAPPLVVLAPSLAWQVGALLYFGATISLIVAPTMPAISDLASYHASRKAHGPRPVESVDAPSVPVDTVADRGEPSTGQEKVPVADVASDTSIENAARSSSDIALDTTSTNGTAYALLNICWALGGMFGPLGAPLIKASLGLLAAMLMFTVLMWLFIPIYDRCMRRRTRHNHRNTVAE